MRHHSSFAWIAVLLTSFVAATCVAEPAAPAPRMTIVEAKYGVAPHWANVTDKFDFIAQQFFVHLKVNAATFGGHRLSKPENKLSVRVRLGDTVAEHQFREGEEVTIVAPSDPEVLRAHQPESQTGLVILEAKTIRSSTFDDYTAAVQSHVKGFKLSAASGYELFDRALQKTPPRNLVIVYIDGNQIKAYFGPADAPVDITATPSKPIPAAASAGAEMITFNKLPVQAANTFALSPDGAYLAIAHLKTDVVTVWDVKAEKVAATLKTTKPSAVFCAGDEIYIANGGKGTISVFSISDQWKQTNELRVDEPTVSYISAPVGKDFKKQLLVRCTDEQLRAHTYVLDAAHDTCRRIDKVFDWAMSSLDGKTIYSQELRGHIFVYSWNELIGKSPQPVCTTKSGPADLLRPTMNPNIWVGRSQVFSGMPPELVNPRLKGGFLFVDSSGPLLYAIDRTGMTAYSLGATVDEIGRRLVSVPGGNPRQVLSLADFSSPERTGSPTAFPVAYSHQDKLYLFAMGANGAIYYAETPAFRKTNPAAPELVNRPEEGELGVPKRVAAGANMSVALKIEGKRVELLTAPDGMKLAADGTLTWSPTDADSGKHALKIRVTTAESITFARPTIEVISSSLLAANEGDLNKAVEPPKLDIKVRSYALTPGRNYRSLLLLQGNELTVLKPDGFTVDQTFQLRGNYEWIAERDDCYIALSSEPQALDVIDKTTLRVRTHVALNYSGVTDLAIHPFKRFSYVATRGGADQPFPRSKIATIDEVSGQITLQPDVVGNRLLVDPTGATLVAGLNEALPANEVIVEQFNDVFVAETHSMDLLMSYDVRSGTPKYRKRRKAPGKMSRMAMSMDGKQFVGLFDLFHPRFNTICAFGVSDLGLQTVYPLGDLPKMEQPPTVVAFHPTLKLMAVARENVLKVFDSVSASGQPDRLLMTSDGLGYAKVETLLFSPDGTKLIIGCNQPGQLRNLRSVPLKLSADERTLAAKGVTPATPATTAPSKPVQMAKVRLADIESLADHKGAAMMPKEISKRFDTSVVVIQSSEGSGSGFFISSKGYLLTCAHVLSEGGPPKVVYFPPGQVDHPVTIDAAVIATDQEHDLALLKIDPPKPVSFVMLGGANPVESGEFVTVIGNPGLGATILSHTMTTGIVSNPKREIDGITFIQTSAAVNPGTSGAPMFDSEGSVLGIVCLKADIEGAGFALPAPRIRDFIKGASDSR